MNKLISLILVALFAVPVSAQTISKIRDRWNAKACITVGPAAFRDGELLPKVLAEREERSLQTGAEAINRAFLAASAADRVAACTALKMPDPEVCR